uniref:Uncharacterized protein n=1 Tax=Cercocebus atys TaxID=9531 RepID=A0A2K5KWV6_CERAT
MEGNTKHKNCGPDSTNSTRFQIRIIKLIKGHTDSFCVTLPFCCLKSNSRSKNLYHTVFLLLNLEE